MASIHDLGGQPGYGRVTVIPDEPPFNEEWERRAFALALLSMRVSGRNLDTFRHTLDSLDRQQYFDEGYYGRWLNAAERMLLDSAIIAPDAVEARARKLQGEDIEEPDAPDPAKPDYAPTGPGSLREVDDEPKFSVGDRVRTQQERPARHTRLPRYVRGRTGVVQRVGPGHLLPDTHAHFEGENPQWVYNVRFDSQELWGPDTESFDLSIDLYESYLEAAS
jgi:nitrile hydratase beta subunit